MNRRDFLQMMAATAPIALGGWCDASAGSVQPPGRVRPGDAGWPSQQAWEKLRQDVGGQLVKLASPFDACVRSPDGADCAKFWKNLHNPFFLGDDPALTQTLGWVDAWTSRPSAYAVAARSTADVVAAVNFARHHNLRLVIKGGGHSYQGTSNAADSLLIWTRHMDSVSIHDAFVPSGCDGQQPTPAVSVGAGVLWGKAYNEVTTKTGRYVQGGGCLTVGVAGLIQSGGFGSFSKAYGLAAASLLEAEVVTADGQVRIANACTHPDLYWAIKGGGSFGVVTRLTLRTYALPEFFGVVSMTVQASSDETYKRLIARITDFYADALFNPNWGEQIIFRPNNVLAINMLFQGLDQWQAEVVWRPFVSWLKEEKEDFQLEAGPDLIAAPARHFWDPHFLEKVPGVVLFDDRPGASADNMFWAGNLEEAGQVLHGYQSAWLPASLLEQEQRQALVEMLFAASRHWSISLHTNKGLAGASAEAIEKARDTAINPGMLDAFALLISAAEGPPAYPGIPGHKPDPARAQRDVEAIRKAMDEVEHLVPGPSSYIAESNFFEERWREAFWGANYPRLLAVKDRYDADGLFISHHGVGSERWSADGFVRRP
ncbi:FAD-binding protein [Mesorhizobium sp. NPDC059054]|uniref:FAD-dependent oxidoreductase n=1 Tax=Mesorhizobium sp. NPDC059054 TaxID=3346711 RepID=UPI0036A72091